MSVWTAEDEVRAAFEYAADILNPKSAVDFTPLEHFRTPPPPWLLWLLFGGRGSGKTAHAAKYVHDHVHGPPCLDGVPGGHWISIVAPTLGDAVTSCVEGPSGLRYHDPGIRTLNRPGGIIAQWSNGAEAKLFGSNSPNDVERFRAGGNRCLVWCEELAAWRYLEESWQQIRYGLRVGPRPHAIASTTPRTRKIIKELVKDPDVVVSQGTMQQNPYLNETIKKQLYRDYAGTRLGRQELLGELLEDVENALWSAEMIDTTRISQSELPRTLARVGVAIDPAASEGGDEHGIIVGGMVNRWDTYLPGVMMPGVPHAFILDDVSCRGKPNVWGKRAIRAYHQYKADFICAEVNNGGDMVEHVIHGIDPNIPFKAVHATRGKARRAEPVANLYSQLRVHHVGMFPHLEDQQTGFDAIDPDESWSPDRMDALVWLVSELMVLGTTSATTALPDKRLKNRR